MINEKVIAGDSLLSVILLHNGPAYLFLDDYFSAYRIHSKGTWNKKDNFNKINVKVHDYKILLKLLPDYNQKIESILKSLYSEISIENAKLGRIIKSFYYHLLSLNSKSDFIKENYFNRLYNLLHHYKNYLIHNY